jgi:hypothetical protein
VKKVENDLVVPLLQGVLFSARENQRYFTGGGLGEFYPEGYALALSILPIIREADQHAAKEIESVMTAFFPGSLDDARANNATKVARAVQQALPKMNGIDCSQIGQLYGWGFCPGDVSVYEDFSSASRSLASLVLTTIAGGALLFAFC